MSLSMCPETKPPVIATAKAIGNAALLRGSPTREKGGVRFVVWSMQVLTVFPECESPLSLSAMARRQRPPDKSGGSFAPTQPIQKVKNEASSISAIVVGIAIQAMLTQTGSFESSAEAPLQVTVFLNCCSEGERLWGLPSESGCESGSSDMRGSFGVGGATGPR